MVTVLKYGYFFIDLKIVIMDNIIKKESYF